MSIPMPPIWTGVQLFDIDALGQAAEIDLDSMAWR